MSKRAYEEKLAALGALRESSDRAGVLDALRKALRDKNNFYVSKAAILTAELSLLELTPDLSAAFDRFLAGGAAADPKCWAKDAIVKALKELGYRGADVYLKGFQHVQLEPVWGGQEDSAAGLRGACALLLADSDLPDMAVLNHLSAGLADGEKTVRVEVARAIGQLGREEALPLLRYKALSGDREAEVVGHCLASMLELGEAAEVGFVARFLESDDDEVKAEAASVLAVSGEAAAMEALRKFWKSALPQDLRQAVLLSLGASARKEAVELLWWIAADEEEPSHRRRAAREALRGSRYARDFAERLERE